MTVDLSNIGIQVVDRITPNYTPRATNSPERIAFINDWPTVRNADSPMSSTQYSLLRYLCKEAGIDLSSCFMGNIVNVIPPKNYFDALGWDSPIVKESVQRLKEDLVAYKPTLIVGLGPLALKLLKDQPDRLDDERGAPFFSKFGGILTICTYHPRDLFKFYMNTKITIFDLAKAKRLSKPGEYSQPKLDLKYQPSFDEVIETLEYFHRTKCWLSCDIETDMRTNTVTCMSFAPNSRFAICVPITARGGKPYWTFEEEKLVWKALAKVLEDNPLIGQNAVHFDHIILAKEHKILSNFAADTMLAHWEVYCEWPKSIAFQSSLYTDSPYWKNVLGDARSGRISYWYEYLYCCQDTIATLNNATKIAEEMELQPPQVREHYLFNVRISRAFQYMTMRGVRFDSEKRDQRVKELQHKERVLEVRLELQANRKLSVGSPKQMTTWLYDELKLPKRYKWVLNKKTGDREDRLTADYLSLLYLAREFPDIEALGTAAELRKLKKRISSLRSIKPNEAGYVSWGFNVVGTLTGRASGYKPYHGYGIQPQNVDRRDRDLFLAEESRWWMQADLEGADSWTVAACLKVLGSSTMMDDLHAGIKPAHVIALARMFGSHLATAPVGELLKLVHHLKEGSIYEPGTGAAEYFLAKPVAHGSAYGMQGKTMHENIFKFSQGEVYVPIHVCEAAQNLLLQRYPLTEWHDFMFGQLKSKGYLDSAAGTRRYFFGRQDRSTLRAFLAHLPQAHTGYAANKVLEGLFYDSDNRRNVNELIVEPVNQVHDEVDMIFRKEDLELAREIFWSKTEIPINVWGEEFVIPFEAAYGDNWGSTDTEMEAPAK